MLKAVLRHDLAACRYAQGDLDGAIKLYRSAADGKLEADDHREAVTSLDALGRALYSAGRYDECRAALAEALAIVDDFAPADGTSLGGYFPGIARQIHANSERAEGRLKKAAALFEQAIESFEQDGRSEGAALSPLLSLGFVAVRLRRADVEEIVERSESLIDHRARLVERQSPKVAALEPAGAEAQGPASTAALRALSPAAVAGLVRLRRAGARVPLPSQDEMALGAGARDELRAAKLLRAQARGIELSAIGHQLAGALFSESAGELDDRRRHLGAQLAVARGDLAAATALLADRRGDGTWPTPVIDALAIACGVPEHRPALDVVADLAALLDESLVGGTGRLVASAALDCGDVALARRALEDIEWAHASDLPGAAAETGVAWFALAAAMEAAGDHEDARSTYERAAKALGTVHPVLEETVLVNVVDMLRGSGKSEAALAIDRNLPLVTQPVGVRVAFAELSLRALRLQTLIGRPLASRALWWNTVSTLRFVAPVGASEPSRRRRRRGSAPVLDQLGVPAVALLELLRQDALDAPERGLAAGLTIAGRDWAATVAAAQELEAAGLGQFDLAGGWVALTALGADVAAQLRAATVA